MPKNYGSEYKVRENIAKFYQPVQMPGGYYFNHVDMLQMVDLYYNSKYKSGQYDNLGYRKFFYNIVKPACDIATKFVDLDTKDIMLVPEGLDDELPTWFMQKKLAYWLEDTDFGCLLNTIAHAFPKYGHVVIKKSAKGEWKVVNIQNLRMDPTVECLDHSPFVYELASMGRHEIEEMGWDTEELYARGDEETFVIYDCYERKGKKWKHTVYGDLYSTMDKNGINRSVESELNDRNDYAGAIVLYEDEVKKLPYRELKWEHVPGRWLGYGFVEYLEENQVAINEAENLERKGLMFTSLKLYQTRDESVGGSNILTNTQNGDILTVSAEITPIAVEERNLGAFAATRANWSQNTERKTFTSDITTGASLPSRTPLGVANLQAAGASSYFELKRENFGLFIKDLLFEDIIPDFKKENRKEHVVMFAGSDQDIDLYDKMVADVLVGTAVAQYAMDTGFYPSKDERELAKKNIIESMKRTKNRYPTVPEGFYDNAKNYVKIVITGENLDNGTKSQVLQLGIQIVGTNPAIVQNKPAMNMLKALLALGGISPAELGLLNDQSPEEAQQMMAQMQQGGQAGSLAKPTTAPGPMRTSTQL